MATNEVQNLMDFIRQHNLNVMRSLYTDGDDDNPISMKDSIKIVAHKMGFGVREDCHPELLSAEIRSIDWALDNGYIEDQWPDERTMAKELEVFTQKDSKTIATEQLAEALDVQPDEIYARQNTLTGLRMVWVGGVIRTLAIEVYRDAFSKGIVVRTKYE